MVNNNTGKNVVPYSVPVNILMHPNGLSFVANSNANKVEVIDMKKFSIVSLGLEVFLMQWHLWNRTCYINRFKILFILEYYL
jgi:hypothetical protein